MTEIFLKLLEIFQMLLFCFFLAGVVFAYYLWKAGMAFSDIRKAMIQFSSSSVRVGPFFFGYNKASHTFGLLARLPKLNEPQDDPRSNP